MLPIASVPVPILDPETDEVPLEVLTIVELLGSLEVVEPNTMLEGVS